MREMNAVVAGGVIPAAVYVEKSARILRGGQMPIGAIHIAAGALRLEIEEDVGEGPALQQIFANLKIAGTDHLAAVRGAKEIVPRSSPSGEIRLPETPVAPAIHAAGRFQLPRK